MLLFNNMADISQAFATNSNYYELNKNINIDHFFTQRKIIEYEEYLDKNMNRKKKIKTRNVNFLAINLPTNDINPINYNCIKLQVQLWGDKGLNFEGTYIPITGIIPNILIKLNNDTQVFINLIIEKDDNKDSYISFIQVPKRYQIEPHFSIDVNNLEVSTQISNLEV